MKKKNNWVEEQSFFLSLRGILDGTLRFGKSFTESGRGSYQQQEKLD